MGRRRPGAQPHQHRRRQGRSHLGGRGRPLPDASRTATRGRPHRRPAGHRRRWPRRHLPHVRAGAGTHRAARRRRDRQPDRRLAAARPDRLHRCGPQPPLRPGHRHARRAAHGLPGRQSRPLAALGHRRPRRQVALQFGQHGGTVHRPVGPHVHVVQQLSARARRPLHVSARCREVRRHPERRRPCLRGRIHGTHERRRHAGRDHRTQLPQQLRAVDDVAR